MVKKQILEAEAMSMYLQGITIKEIGKQLGKHYRTIGNWKVKYEWAKVKSKIDEVAVKNARETLDDRRERMLKMAKAIQGNFARQLQEKKVKVNANETLKAMDFEAKLEGLMIDKVEHSGNIDGKVKVRVVVVKKDGNSGKK